MIETRFPIKPSQLARTWGSDRVVCGGPYADVTLSLMVEAHILYYKMVANVY